MKLALVSDIHANVEALRATLADIAAQSLDRVVCLGDIVGYNTDPGECIALLRSADALCIAGNHDRAVCGAISTEGFSPTAARAVAWTQARLSADEIAFLAGLPLRATIDNKLLLVHGAFHPSTGCEIVRLDSAEKLLLSFQALAADPSGARIGAFGHTHLATVYELAERGASGPVALGLSRATMLPLRDDAAYLLNPGTVGEPRGADRRACYMVLDLARRTLAPRAVAYDFSVPLKKTYKAGLGPRLAFLPTPMRRALKEVRRRIAL